MTKQNSMLTGKPIKSIIKFSLPIMASSLLQYNYTLVDNILVGRYVSTDALAAVGGVASINSFIVGAALGLTSGFTIPVAHAYGAKDQDRVNRYSGIPNFNCMNAVLRSSLSSFFEMCTLVLRLKM